MRVTIVTSFKGVSDDVHKANCEAAQSILGAFSESVDTTSDNYSDFFGADVDEKDLGSLRDAVANENETNGNALSLNHN